MRRPTLFIEGRIAHFPGNPENCNPIERNFSDPAPPLLDTDALGSPKVAVNAENSKVFVTLLAAPTFSAMIGTGWIEPYHPTNPNAFWPRIVSGRRAFSDIPRQEGVQ
jgi:hypothetical protein